jgi:hypothetical protein
VVDTGRALFVDVFDPRACSESRVPFQYIVALVK